MGHSSEAVRARKVRQAIPPGIEERWAEVDGKRMRYLHGGSGPAVLFLHGLMGYSFSWSENLAELARDFTVYAPDLFNCGWSDRVEQDGRLETTARSALAFMDAVGVPRAHLVGSSHGGTLAMLAAALAPERCDKVVAISPANPWSEKRRWQARVFATWWGSIAGRLAPYAAPVVHGYFMMRLYADRSRVLPGTVAGYNAPLKVPGTVRYLLAVMRWWREDFGQLSAQWGPLQNKHLIFIWGDADSVVPLRYREDLAREFPQAKFLVIPDAGHLPYEERPEMFNEMLRECLRG
ncbi:MAG: alpha/beta hydrolase [Terriglobales bacterium]